MNKSLMTEWLGVFMLEAKGISYRHTRGSWLFRNVDITIRPGEVVGLYGVSGSGKTTMAQCLTGYLTALEGSVHVDDIPYPAKGVHPVQLVWQHPEQAVNPRWRMKQVLEETTHLDELLLQILNIDDAWMRRFPSELSGGELQRFCLVRALSKSTKYLIADEMTTMLDAITQAQIWHAVLQLVSERNLGVLAISHDKQLLQRVSDRILNFSTLIQDIGKIED